MALLNSMFLSGGDVLPLIEGGKGVAVSNGLTAGAWAAAGGVGTFSGVNADFAGDDGSFYSPIYTGKTRRERHDELIAQGIKGAITQARIAYETASNKGRIHMNVLWEMGGCEDILKGALDGAKGLIHGVTCGAGMPYKLGEIAAHFNVSFYPIVSSARAFNALWKRAYGRVSEWLGAVVYEDPWLAGGHNGLSNSENPLVPQTPFERVLALRTVMKEVGLAATPIIMAGGVWCLNEWSDWIANPDLGPIAFQLGTRPLLTVESPISPEWKEKLLTLKAGDVSLNPFSPTGFYSSAVRNDFLDNLAGRSDRQIPFRRKADDIHRESIAVGARGRLIYTTVDGKIKASAWMAAGLTAGMGTPDQTMIFVTPDESAQIQRDQADCMGCLSSCRFSNWNQHNDGYTTGLLADPRSYCIQKTLQDVAHGGSIDHNLMFAGHNAYRFADDPFYANGFIPTVRQLVDRLQTGY